MLESFKQQEQMSVLELYIEKDVAGGSMFHSANSLTSYGNYLSNDETQPPTNMSNLHLDEDDDDDYLVSNSYVEESLDEDESVDDISDTDDEVTDMIQPVRIVHPAKGIENPFWNDALHYNNINWSYLDEEDICGLEMPSTFNAGQELYVGMEFDNMIKEDPSIKVSLIQERITSEFTYKVSYKKAWLAKKKAIAIEYGDWDESYPKLSSWLTHMQNHSPGSYFRILHDDFIIGNTVSREHRQFHRVFWTFGQCKEAFKYCKPIIQVDGKYRGTLLMATSQDGNGCVLPLAFAVVEGETLTAWSWFLAHLREHVTDKNGICLIYDRHASIKYVVANEALGWQPPHGYHPTLLASTFFYQNLEKFRQLSPATATWIDRISKEKWTMAYDREGRRYGHMTTNLSKCINKVLKDCCNIPITALVKSTYSRCRKYFVERGRQAQRQLNEGQVYCSKLVKELRKNQEQACSHIVPVYDIHSTRFEVEETFNPITQHACGYVSMNYYQYIDVVYTNEHILKAYSTQWWPLGNEATIPPSNDAWTLIPDPTTICVKGRPKSTRIRNEMDWVEPSEH
ncbi:hypothetical protein GmHk_08G023764 [Glycine max]|nr:hypothetical protein GmHk_08G023764 [Glycine max]